MAVHDRVDVRPHLVDLAMDEALAIGRAAVGIDRIAVEIEGDDVRHRHVARRHRLHLQIAVGIARVAHADMAEGVEHAVLGEDVVGRHQIGRDRRVEIGIAGAELDAVLERFRHQSSQSVVTGSQCGPDSIVNRLGRETSKASREFWYPISRNNCCFQDAGGAINAAKTKGARGNDDPPNLPGWTICHARACARPPRPVRRRRRRFLQGQDRPGDHRHRRRRHLRRLRPAGGAAFRPLHPGPSDGGDAVDAGGGRLHRAQLARHRGAARRHRRHHRPHQYRARGPVQHRGEVRSARLPVGRALHELRVGRRRQQEIRHPLARRRQGARGRGRRAGGAVGAGTGADHPQQDRRHEIQGRRRLPLDRRELPGARARRGRRGGDLDGRAALAALAEARKRRAHPDLRAGRPAAEGISRTRRPWANSATTRSRRRSSACST